MGNWKQWKLWKTETEIEKLKLLYYLATVTHLNIQILLTKVCTYIRSLNILCLSFAKDFLVKIFCYKVHIASVLGNISIFWEYRDISLDNILYRRHSLILKYHISIFIVFMYVKAECNGSL